MSYRPIVLLDVDGVIADFIGATRRCRSFDAALGRAADDGTPEAALGLLYRERLVKRG